MSTNATSASNTDEGGITAPVHHLDLVGETERIRAEESWESVGHSARTIVKHPDLRIVLIVMKAGAHIKEHQAPGRISIQTLAGHLQVNLSGQIVDLPAAHLLAVAPGTPHDVSATKESSFLLTISWRK